MTDVYARTGLMRVLSERVCGRLHAIGAHHFLLRPKKGKKEKKKYAPPKQNCERCAHYRSLSPRNLNPLSRLAHRSSYVTGSASSCSRHSGSLAETGQSAASSPTSAPAAFDRPISAPRTPPSDATPACVTSVETGTEIRAHYAGTVVRTPPFLPICA